MVAVFLDSPGGQHVPVKHREGENYLGKRRLIEQIIKAGGQVKAYAREWVMCNDQRRQPVHGGAPYDDEQN